MCLGRESIRPQRLPCAGGRATTTRSTGFGARAARLVVPGVSAGPKLARRSLDMTGFHSPVRPGPAPRSDCESALSAGRRRNAGTGPVLPSRILKYRHRGRVSIRKSGGDTRFVVIGRGRGPPPSPGHSAAAAIAANGCAGGQGGRDGHAGLKRRGRTLTRWTNTILSDCETGDFTWENGSCILDPEPVRGSFARAVPQVPTRLFQLDWRGVGRSRRAGLRLESTGAGTVAQRRTASSSARLESPHVQIRPSFPIGVVPC